MKYICILFALTTILFSAPARDSSRVFTQKNGVNFHGHPRGDEHLHWIESADGVILKYNPATKNYELAEIRDHILAPSGKKYISGVKRANSRDTHTLTKKSVLELWRKKREAHRLKMGYGNKFH